MTSHDDCRRRRAAVRGGGDVMEAETITDVLRYPIIARPVVDQRSTTATGSSCSERHVTPGDDDDATVPERVTAVHRRRRRTAFTSEQVTI